MTALGYAQGRYATVPYTGAGTSGDPERGGGTVGTGSGSGLEMAGILNYLAGVTTGPMMGPVLAAQAAWAPINSHGAKAANADGSLLGALNLKAGTVGLDINLVCNVLAGTTGLEAALALRTYAGLP